jgi:hypothetical protein
LPTAGQKNEAAARVVERIRKKQIVEDDHVRPLGRPALREERGREDLDPVLDE